MVGNGRDLIWVAGKPARSATIAATLPPRPRSKSKLPADNVPAQAIQKASPAVTSGNNRASENIDPVTTNLTFAQLCQEDKNKIGALIRKLITMKAEHCKEAENVHQEKMKFDEELQSIQQHNEKIQHQARELKKHFSSSLALLKIYKEKVHQQEAEKAERDHKISDLTRELESIKEQLIKIREQSVGKQEPRQSKSDADHGDRSPEIRASDSEPVAAASISLSEENRRLKRLLDIQNTNEFSRLPKRLDKIDSLDDRTCDSRKQRSGFTQCPEKQTVCTSCLHNEQISQTNTAAGDVAINSIPAVENTHQGPADDENDSDDVHLLIKELNNHRDHVETLLYLHNDASLLRSLENINADGSDAKDKQLLYVSSDSDDDEFLQTITKDLNRKHKTARDSIQINGASGFT